MPAYAFPENAARALGKVAAYAEWRAQPPALFWSFDDIRVDEARDRVPRRARRARGDGWLTGEEVRRVLGAFGLPLVPTHAARIRPTKPAALARRARLPGRRRSCRRAACLHKTDVGGVQWLNLPSGAVRRAFREISRAGRRAWRDGATIDGVLIQPMMTGGVETMIGVTDDPLFGPLVAFGLGGIHVEVLATCGSASRR